MSDLSLHSQEDSFIVVSSNAFFENHSLDFFAGSLLVFQAHKI